MKRMFDMRMFGASRRMKVLTILLLGAVWAMFWTFMQVGRQAELDQMRLADVGDQLVLSQRLAKYALAATSGDTEAFENMSSSKQKFSAIIDKQIADYGGKLGESDAPESIALTDLDNIWSGFRYSIDAVLEGKFLIMATAEATSLMSEVMPQLMEHTQDIADTLVS